MAALRRVHLALTLPLAVATARSPQPHNSGSSVHHATVAPLRNVVLMVMDDARPDQHYAYGQPEIRTPNMDRLAQGGLVFRRAYSQFPVCGPSRNSFMTGRRPDTTRVFNFLTSFRDAPGGGEWVSLPQHFKIHNYTALGSGKLYHTNCAPVHWSCDACTVAATENQPPNQDEPFSWSQDRPYQTPCQEYCPPQKGAPNGGGYGGPAACGDDAPFTAFNDYNSTVQAIDNLRYAAAKGTPFFIGMGVFKPHYPWHIPQQFVDLYNETTLAPPAHPLFPQGTPPWAFDHGLDGVQTLELLNASAPSGLARVPVPPLTAAAPMPLWVYQAMRRGYYSAMSWSDHLIGMMLDELDTLGLTNRTLVVLTSDHGYHLGEMGLWAKQTLFEDATHVPLTIRAPWLPRSIGQHTSSFIELVDLFPTIADLAGLPLPDGVDGVSQAAVVQNPESVVKDQAFSQYPRCGSPGGPATCSSRSATEIEVMGVSVRADGGRLTQWRRWDQHKLCINWSAAVVGVEFYPHIDDPSFGHGLFDEWEVRNQADNQTHATVIAQLTALLRSQFDPAVARVSTSPPSF